VSARLRRLGGLLGITAGLALLGLPALAVLVSLGPEVLDPLTTMVVAGGTLALLLGFYGLFGKWH
jgi:hypothetical protein